MKHFVLPLVLILSCNVSFGAEPVSLSKLTHQARAGHPAIESGRADVESAKASRTALLAPYKPQMSLNGYGAFGPASMIFPGTVDPPNYENLANNTTGELNATFMWKVFTFGRDKDLAAAGSAGVRSSQASLKAQELDLDYSVRLAFSDALYKREMAQSLVASQERATELLRVTQARFDAGKVPELFVFRAKADAATAERDVAVAQADEDGAIAALWNTAGFDQDSGLELGGWDVPLTAPETLKSAMSIALRQRPELASIQESLSQAKGMRSAAEKSSLPELSVMGMNDWAGQDGVNGSSTYKAGLVLSFPLGDGGARSADRMAASSTVRQDEAKLRAMKNQIEAEVATAWAQWNAGSQVEAAAASEIEASDKGYEIALLRYQDGKAILAEVIDSLSQLNRAKLDQAGASAYRRKAWSMLMRAIGEDVS